MNKDLNITDDTIMWFGKYKGTKLANVPDEYLLYLYNINKAYGKLKEYIENNLDNLKLK